VEDKRCIKGGSLPGQRGTVRLPLGNDQITFPVKSFFFLLIGLMYPTTPRLIALAVAFAMRGQDGSRKSFLSVTVAIARGLAAGVLWTLALQAGIPGVKNLSSVFF